jgi:2-dehydropantoate 2-reductase
VPQGLPQKNWRRAVALPVLDEGLEILRAADVQLIPIPGLSDIFRLRRLLALFDRLPGTDAVVRAALAAARKKPLVFSVYQDLCRGRPTEIEFVNGEIVRLARQVGAEAPNNALTVAMVHELEQRDPVDFFEPNEVIARFRHARSGRSDIH